MFDIFEILIMKIKYFSKVYKLYTPFFYNVLWLRTEREGWNRSLNKNAKNGTEREGRSSTQNGTERDGTERERNDKKKERERNDQAEAPRSRTERNDFKKVGTCPALDVPPPPYDFPLKLR